MFQHFCATLLVHDKFTKRIIECLEKCYMLLKKAKHSKLLRYSYKLFKKVRIVASIIEHKIEEFWPSDKVAQKVVISWGYLFLKNLPEKVAQVANFCPIWSHCR